jgi:hypothetical protein
MLHGVSSFEFEQKKSALRTRSEGSAIQQAGFLLKLQQKNADVTKYKKRYTGKRRAPTGLTGGIHI